LAFAVWGVLTAEAAGELTVEAAAYLDPARADGGLQAAPQAAEHRQ
jgi:hypothetical protein